MRGHLHLLFLAIFSATSAAQGPAVSPARRGLVQELGDPRVVPAPGTVKSCLEIASLPGVAHLGWAVAFLGDVDGDGVGDLAVGDPFDDAGQPFSRQGAAHVVFLNANASVKAVQTITEGQGGFAGSLAPDDLFGASVARLGDLDGDGISELLVGAPQDDVLVPGFPRAWLLLLAFDGTVKSQVQYSQGLAGFQETIQDSDAFGSAFAPLGDIDGNGAPDFVVTQALGPSSSNFYSFTLRLKPDGSVKNTLKVGPGLGGYVGTTNLRWGHAAAGLPDLDGDGIGDYTIGDPGFGSDTGELVVLFPDLNGALHGQQRIRPNGAGLQLSEGGFSATLDHGDAFGGSLAAVGDLDGDGIGDLAVGASGDTEGPPGNQPRHVGALWTLFLNADGTVHGHQKISAWQGGLQAPLQEFDSFGYSLAALGDQDVDGVPDLIVGAPGNGGSFYLLFLNGG